MPPPPIPPPNAAPGEAEGLAVVRAAVPPSLTKAGLTRGLQHTTGLVRHATLCLLLQVLRAIRGRVARLEEAARSAPAGRLRRVAHANDADDADDAGFTALAEQARRAALAVLPDPQALLAVHAARRTHPPLHPGFATTRAAEKTQTRNDAGRTAPTTTWRTRGEGSPRRRLG